MKREIISLAVAAAFLSGCSTEETPNILPTVSIQNVIADEQTVVTLVADALDEDGTIASFEWVQSSGDPVTVDATNEATISFLAPDISEDQEVIFTVKITDDRGDSASASGAVKIIANLPPTATVNESDVAYSETDTVELSVTASDTDGDIASYAWLQTAGETVEITGGDSDTISFISPASREDATFAFDVTVTDNDGDTFTTSAMVDVLEITREFSISGIVTDEPIANAQVSLFGGEIDLSAEATTDGRYVLEVVADNEDDSALLRLDAVGVNDQDFVMFRSYVDSLIQLSDSGTVLNEDDNFSFNVTNVSTALAGLLESANEGVITSPEMLDATLSLIDLTQLMPYATALKVLVDGTSTGERPVLPEGITNTLELVQSPDVMTAFVESVKTDYPTDYADAQTAILSDTKLTNANLTEEDFIGQYYFLGANGKADLGKLSLMEDGQASLTDLDVSLSGIWNLQDGVAVLSGLTDSNSDDGVTTISTITMQNIVSSDVNALSNITLTRMVDDVNLPSSSLETHVSPGGFLPLNEFQGNVLLQGTPYSYVDEAGYTFISTVTEITINNGDYSISQTTRTEPDATPISPITYSNTGTLTLNEQGTLATIMINDTPLSFGLVRELDNGYLSVSEGRSISSVFDGGSGEQVVSNPQFAGSGIAYVRNESTVDTASIVGIYELVSGLQSSYFEFKEDGSFTTTTWSDLNENGIIDDYELSASEGFFKVENGSVMARFYQGTVGGDCSGQTGYDNLPGDNCIIHRDISFDVLSFSDDESGKSLDAVELSSFTDLSVLSAAEGSVEYRISLVVQRLLRLTSVDEIPSNIAINAAPQAIQTEMQTLEQIQKRVQQQYRF